MAEDFDAYYKWLGIRPEVQPADHYRLLGIGLFESDPDVIEGAADRQMAHVQKHKLGRHSAVSQKILNELAAAKVTLLNPAKKAAYDDRLRSKQRPAGEGQTSAAAKAVPRAKSVTAPSPLDAVVDDSLDFVHRETPTAGSADRDKVRGARKRPAGKKQPGWKGPGTYATALLVVGILGVSVMLWVRGKNWQIHLVEGDQPVAQAGPASSKSADRTAKPSSTASDPAPDPAPDKKPPKGAPPAEPPSSAKSQQPLTAANSPAPATPGPAATVATPPLSPPAAPPAAGANGNPSAGADAPRPAVATRPVPKIKNKPGERFAPFRVLQDGNPQRFTSTLAFSADGRWVFWAGRQQTFDEQRKSHSTTLNNLWDVRSDGPPTSFDWNQAPLRAAAFTADSTRLILVFSQEIRIWEMATRRLTQIAKSRGALSQFAPDASCLASAELDTLSVLDPLSGASIARATLPGNASNVALSPGRRYLFVAGSVFRDNKLAGRYMTVVDLQAKAQVPIDYPPAVNASDCCISTQGNLAFYSNDPNALHVWSIPEKKLLFSVPMMIPNEVRTMRFTSDGARLVVSSVDASLRIWDVASGELLREFPMPEQPWFTYMIKLAGDDNTAVTDGAGHSVLLWKLETTMDVPPPPIPANAAPPTVVDLNVGNGAMAAVTPPALPLQPPVVETRPASVAGAVPAFKPSGARMSVPNESARLAAQKLIREVFGAELAKAKRPADKLALAEKLQSQATQSQAAAEKYVLLEQARDLACEAGEPTQFLKSLDALAEAFSADVPAMALVGANQMSEKLAPKTRFDLAKGLLPLVDLALQEDHYDTAEKLVEVALSSARKAKDGALVKQVVERKSGVQEIKKQESEISAARETLAKNAGDPAANLALGKFYCLLKDDWSRGLPLLARSGDNSLQELAAQEIAEPKTPGERMKLADGWYTLGQSAGGHEKTKYLSHAVPWYRKALPELSGITLLKVQKRLEELDGTAGR